MVEKNSAFFNGQTSHEERKLLTEIVVLSIIFIGLLVLAVRPFGFTTFVNGLGHDNIFSLLLVASAVAIFLVLLQRIGIIFPDELEGGEQSQ
jgi:hypothetical protein